METEVPTTRLFLRTEIFSCQQQIKSIEHRGTGLGLTRDTGAKDTRMVKEWEPEWDGLKKRQFWDCLGKTQKMS